MAQFYGAKTVWSAPWKVVLPEVGYLAIGEDMARR